MKKLLTIVLAVVALTAFIAIGVAQEQLKTQESKADKSSTVDLKSQVQKWGEATLIMKDDKGNVILNKTEKYPIIDKTVKEVPFNNCWDYCKRVCDGYGVCWVSCGWHCSPWTREIEQ